MARFNTILAAFAGAGLALAQPTVALAQSDDAGSLEDAPGSGPVVGLIALVGLVFLVMVIAYGDNPVDDLPISP